MEKFLTLKQVAEKLHITPKYMSDSKRGWRTWGIQAIRLGGSGHILFKESDINRMVERWKIYQ